MTFTVAIPQATNHEYGKTQLYVKLNIVYLCENKKNHVLFYVVIILSSGLVKDQRTHRSCNGVEIEPSHQTVIAGKKPRGFSFVNIHTLRRSLK